MEVLDKKLEAALIRHRRIRGRLLLEHRARTAPPTARALHMRELRAERKAERDAAKKVSQRRMRGEMRELISEIKAGGHPDFGRQSAVTESEAL